MLFTSNQEVLTEFMTFPTVMGLFNVFRKVVSCNSRLKFKIGFEFTCSRTSFRATFLIDCISLQVKIEGICIKTTEIHAKIQRLTFILG